MALAEARAAWQRTANRCLVQEDAKRAPKLACCSSVPPSAKQAGTEPNSAVCGQDIPITGPAPFNRAPSYSNLSPSSRWWLQLQPNHGYQKGLIDEQLSSENMETCQMHESSEILNGDNNLYRKFATCENKESGFGAFYSRNLQKPLKHEVEEEVRELRGKEVLNNANEIYFVSESSWIGVEKNTPWWRTVDTEELALLVAQRSNDLIENCDLPRPYCEISKSSLDSKPGASCCDNLNTHACAPGRSTVRSDSQLISADKQLSDSSTRKMMHGALTLEKDASKAKLLEALRHSQTRARKAEKAAKQTSLEKEHVVKLVFRQASQLFAYKQWLQLLQLENMYFQFKNTTNRTLTSNVVPTVLPWTPQKTRKMRKNWQKPKKRMKWAHPRCDVSEYAVVFALGLGLVGAGLILGWTIG